MTGHRVTRDNAHECDSANRPDVGFRTENPDIECDGRNVSCIYPGRYGKGKWKRRRLESVRDIESTADIKRVKTAPGGASIVSLVLIVHAIYFIFIPLPLVSLLFCSTNLSLSSRPGAKGLAAFIILIV